MSDDCFKYTEGDDTCIVPNIEQVVDGMMDLFEKNLIAKTNVTSNVTTGDIVVNVDNSFRFKKGQEIVLIDYGYNDPASPHYKIYEYARIKEVNNTTAITLCDEVVGNWLVADRAFIQKTIGHSPLYSDRIYYGDREVIPSEDMSITIEPVNLTNEWVFLPGGLNEQTTIQVTIYGKDIETEQGLRIIHKYGDAVYRLLTYNIHLPVNAYSMPLAQDVSAGSDTIRVYDTPTARELFMPMLPPPSYLPPRFELQDNNNTQISLEIVSTTPVVGGYLDIKLKNVLNPSQKIVYDFKMSDYAIFIRHGRYFWQSRVTNVDYGEIQKGSAFIRAARMTWIGEEIHLVRCPQPNYSADYRIV